MVKVRYEGPESMFTYFGPSGKKYVFVGKIPTEVDDVDIEPFETGGGFTLLRDDLLGSIKTEEVKEQPQEVKAGKKRITKKEDDY
jgi:hypothetical protein